MTFPALLNVLMLGSLACIPVIRLTEQKHTYAAELSVVHSEPVSEKTVEQVLQAQSRVLGAFRKEGVHCTCTDYFVGLLSQTGIYRSSTHPDRLAHCLTHILDNMDLQQFDREKQACLICQYHLNPSVVQDAIEVAEMTIGEGKGRLLRVAQTYESWLFSDCLKLLRTACELDKPIRAVKKFEYL